MSVNEFMSNDNGKATWERYHCYIYSRNDTARECVTSSRYERWIVRSSIFTGLLIHFFGNEDLIHVNFYRLLCNHFEEQTVNQFWPVSDLEISSWFSYKITTNQLGWVFFVLIHLYAVNHSMTSSMNGHLTFLQICILRNVASF